MDKLNIAIADDNAKVLQLLDKIVSSDEELNVVGKAGNGEDLYDIIKKQEPDVVLLDLVMPKVDGLTVMERVNKDQEIRKHPAFIVITAVGQDLTLGKLLQGDIIGEIRTKIHYLMQN